MGEKAIGSSLRLVYRGIVHSKKNSKRIIINRKTGRTSLISSDAARANELEMVLQFKTQCPRNLIPSPLKVLIEIYEPNRTRRDLDNQATTILDALTKAEIIEDDSINHIRDLHVIFAGIDREDPRAVINISHKES